MSSSSFLEKEREPQYKIEELENKVEEFDHGIAMEKVVEVKSITVDHLNDTTTSMPEENGALSLFNSNVYVEEQAEISIMDNGDGILTELSSLKVRNHSMENELNDMQERYSEMSLKFAEVEGERQKLVMTIRTLKNARKASN